MKKHLMYSILSIFLAILFITLASAVQPQVSFNQQEGLQVSYPKFDAVSTGQGFNLSVHIFNVSNGILITSPGASCELEIYNHQGAHVVEAPLSPDGDEFSVSLNSNNFSIAGQYSYNIYCNTTSLGGFVDGLFVVSNTGEIPDTAGALFYLGLLGLLVFFLCLIFWAHMRDQSELARFWWFSFMWIPIWAILFIGWNMARDFLSSQGAIQGVLYWAWLVIAIVYPFFLLALVLYTFYYIYKQKEVQRLVTRGFSLEEAEGRVNGRGRGMRYG